MDDSDSLLWEQEQIAALSSTLEYLDVQDGSGDRIPLIPESLETLNVDDMIAAPCLVEGPPIIGSDKLHLKTFTLVTQPEIPGAGAASYYNIVVRVEGLSLFTPSNDEDLSDDIVTVIPLLDTIKLSTIGDKFPIYDLKGLTTGNTFLIKCGVNLGFHADHKYPIQYLAHMQLQSSNLMSISITTRICTFGKLVEEKTEPLQSNSLNVDQVTYSVGSLVCERLLIFIEKVRACGPMDIVNSIVENFNIVQVISDDVTKDVLMCLAYMFDVSSPQQRASSKIFRLDTSGFKPDPKPDPSLDANHSV